ncbi:peptide-N4-asparagine amidase [Stygiolobus azoricus]|uniref:Glycopeptidase n=1 Tax=Stygiolobus azoricus TaxID=41675 RepID=A0A650CRX2_9CREN|nr:glycopeptidase [Stygiolobus azoricus]
MKKFFILFLVFLIVFSPTYYSLNIVNIHENNLTISKPQLLYNITSPILEGFTDPKYYSFQAYEVKPPNVTPVIIHVATNAIFNNTGLTPENFTVEVPNGSYSMIIMNVSISESNGTQYDRAVYIFVDGVPIFWGSTQEINNSTASVDLTMFENLLVGRNVTFQAVIENFYDAKIGITGVYHLNITLLLYPGIKPKGLPNMFIPLFVSKYNYSYIILNPLNPSVSQVVNIPNGTYMMKLLIYEEGGGLDEFWYANEPATRSIEVYYNGSLVGVVNPYETIYTGGIDLFWWKPMPSINTLAFHTPYIIDLTPMLALGNKGVITVHVTNLREALQITGSTAFDWDVAGVLMLWVNTSNPLISGKLLTSYARYIDSTPIFTPGFPGIYYQEVGNYLLNYSAILKFKSGTEYSLVTQEGRFTAYQTFNNIYEKAYLDEKFSEYSLERGLVNSSMVIRGYYPILLQFSAFATPISNPNVIPYNLTYIQNGTLSLGLYYYFSTSYSSSNTTMWIKENETSIGGFSGILEIINSYGGAILVSLTSNNALTEKSLTAEFLVNGEGYKELFNAEALQNSTTNLAGYYIKISVNYIPIS